MMPLLHRLSPLLTQLLNAVYPPSCLVCEMEMAQPGICATCRDTLPTLREGTCPRCGSYIAPNTNCPTCHATPHPPDAFYCPLLYEPPLITLIHNFKFNDRPHLDQILAGLIWTPLAASLTWEAPDMVLPVPLHVTRLLRRGYNQSALLARILANQLHRPLVTNRLFRIKMTTSQFQLGRAARLTNLKGAFRAKNVAGKAILLVDDVMTSGATLLEATATLKQAGASRVALVCLARTAPDHHGQGSAEKNFHA